MLNKLRHMSVERIIIGRLAVLRIVAPDRRAA